MKNFNRIILLIVGTFFIIALIVKIHSLINISKESDWNYKQIQRVDREKKEFSFIVFGDNKNSIKTFGSLINKINKEDFLFAVACGDLVYDGNKEKYNFVLRQLKKIDKPVLTVIGNHEIADNGRGNYYNIFGNFYYSFIVGNSYFIILDDANEKELDSWQMEWLRNELEKSKKFQYRFLFMHVPLFDPRDKKSGKLPLYIPIISEYEYFKEISNRNQAIELSKLFNKYDITHVFFSHIHGYFTGSMGNIPYTITGGAGAELLGADPEHYFNHYIKVDVKKENINCEVVRIKTPRAGEFFRVLDLLGVYVYAFFVVRFWDIVLILATIYFLWYFIIHRRKLHKKGF